MSKLPKCPTCAMLGVISYTTVTWYNEKKRIAEFQCLPTNRQAPHHNFVKSFNKLEKKIEAQETMIL